MYLYFKNRIIGGPTFDIVGALMTTTAKFGVTSGRILTCLLHQLKY